jgi:hypothetical protein
MNSDFLQSPRRFFSFLIRFNLALTDRNTEANLTYLKKTVFWAVVPSDLMVEVYDVSEVLSASIVMAM